MPRTPYLGTTRLVRQDPVRPGITVMRLAVPGRFAVQAGQFVHLRISGRTDPLLRRPFSILDYRWRGASTLLDILYAVVGRGTREMSAWRPGDEVDCFGPLGNGYPIRPHAGKILLVAGGYGVAPLYLLAKQVLARNRRASITAFVGARTRAGILLTRPFRSVGVPVVTSTEDGSQGRRGLVTQGLLEKLERVRNSRRVELYACGPDGMLRAVARIALERSIPCWLSLDQKMGCAYSVCRACVVRVRRPGSDEIRPATVCRDGPVFEAREIAEYP